MKLYSKTTNNNLLSFGYYILKVPTGNCAMSALTTID